MFKKNKKDYLELACPECEVLTKVKTEEGVKCTGCETSFKGMLFKQKKILTKSSAYLIVAGAIGGMVLDNTIEDSRLPYAAEFKLMEHCINANSGLVDARQYNDRIDMCSCAIRKSVNDLGVGRDRNEPDEVLEAFSREVRKAANEC